MSWPASPISIPRARASATGSYGVYYAAAELETAIAETVFHFEAFARASHDPPRTEALRVLVGSIDAPFHTLPEPEQAAVLDPNSYVASQALAKRLRAAGSNGIVYASVRKAGGACVGAFRPKAVGLPRQERHLHYRWNGDRVDRYFDGPTSLWIAI
jgi:RES domain